jgi:transcriptional regulator with XRE-family HTH domain
MTRAQPASERGIASPTVIDAHVGTRIRLRRMMLGLPMTQVAKELGISFQQLEKYERASGRISASKLYLIASALGATVDFFFAEIQLDPTDGRSVERSETAVIADLLMRDARGQHIGQLIASYWRIKDARLRRHMLDLIHLLADQADAPNPDTKHCRGNSTDR